MHRSTLLAVILLPLALGLAVLAYWKWSQPADPYQVTGPIEFRDDAATNTDITTEQLDLTFVDSQGKERRISDLRGKKNVVLVVTRGYFQARCPYCTAQTARLIQHQQQFAERNAEVLVVYPGPLGKVDEFLAAAKGQANQPDVPFTLLYDEGLVAVDRLGIRDKLAKPSTFVLDRDGKLQFAYVGRDRVDRPSIKALLAQLDRLAPPQKSESQPDTAEKSTPAPTLP